MSLHCLENNVGLGHWFVCIYSLLLICNICGFYSFFFTFIYFCVCKRFNIFCIYIFHNGGFHEGYRVENFRNTPKCSGFRLCYIFG